MSKTECDCCYTASQEAWAAIGPELSIFTMYTLLKHSSRPYNMRQCQKRRRHTVTESVSHTTIPQKPACDEQTMTNQKHTVMSPIGQVLHLINSSNQHRGNSGSSLNPTAPLEDPFSYDNTAPVDSSSLLSTSLLPGAHVLWLRIRWISEVQTLPVGRKQRGRLAKQHVAVPHNLCQPHRRWALTAAAATATTAAFVASITTTSAAITAVTVTASVTTTIRQRRVTTSRRITLQDLDACESRYRGRVWCLHAVLGERVVCCSADVQQLEWLISGGVAAQVCTDAL